jgi:hypothetical protein
LWLTTEGPSETYRIKSLPCNLSTLSINFHILGLNGSSSSYQSAQLGLEELDSSPIQVYPQSGQSGESALDYREFRRKCDVGWWATRGRGVYYMSSEAERLTSLYRQDRNRGD